MISGTLQSPAAWEKLLVDAAVIGGRDRWARRLRGLEAEFRMRLADLGQKEEGRRQHLLREIARLKNLERFALPLIDRLAALPRQAAWGDWIEHLQRSGRRRAAPPRSRCCRCSANCRPWPRSGRWASMKSPACFPTACAFCAASRPCAAMAASSWAASTKSAAASSTSCFCPDSAKACSPAARTKIPSCWMFTATSSNAGLRVQDDRVAAERRRLHIACAAARTRLVFSYPRMDAVESRPRVPSFYALEIVRAAHGRLPDLRTFEENARRARPRAWIGPRRSTRGKPSTMPSSIWRRSGRTLDADTPDARATAAT